MMVVTGYRLYKTFKIRNESNYWLHLMQGVFKSQPDSAQSLKLRQEQDHQKVVVRPVLRPKLVLTTIISVNFSDEKNQCHKQADLLDIRTE